MGHLYVDTVTPDGYRVGPDGAWTGEESREDRNLYR